MFSRFELHEPSRLDSFSVKRLWTSLWMFVALVGGRTESGERYSVGGTEPVIGAYSEISTIGVGRCKQ